MCPENQVTASRYKVTTDRLQSFGLPDGRNSSVLDRALAFHRVFDHRFKQGRKAASRDVGRDLELAAALVPSDSCLR